MSDYPRLAGAFGVNAEILESDHDRAKAALTVPEDFPYLRGHFPSLPVVPGMLVVDLIYNIVLSTLRTQVSDLVHVRFHSPLLPGETLILECILSPTSHEATARGTVDGRAYCTAVLKYDEEKV